MIILVLASCAMVVASVGAGVALFLEQYPVMLAMVSVMTAAAAIMWRIVDSWAQFDDER